MQRLEGWFDPAALLPDVQLALLFRCPRGRLPAKEALERQLDATEQASRALALEHEHAIACEREGKRSAEERAVESNEALRESQAVAREASDARARAETRLHELEQTNADLARQLSAQLMRLSAQLVRL